VGRCVWVVAQHWPRYKIASVIVVTCGGVEFVARERQRSCAGKSPRVPRVFPCIFFFILVLFERRETVRCRERLARAKLGLGVDTNTHQ